MSSFSIGVLFSECEGGESSPSRNSCWFGTGLNEFVSSREIGCAVVSLTTVDEFD